MIALALEAKADLVELDYHHSSDGVPIVIHDGTFDRTTNSRSIFKRKNIRAASLLAVEIDQLDAGRWYGPQFAGTRVPTLHEALAVITSNGTILIERKDGDAHTLAAIFAEEKNTSNIVVQSFDWKFLAELNQIAPNIDIIALGNGPISLDVVADVQSIGAKGINWNHLDINLDGLKIAHQNQMTVWAYTVNDASRIADLNGMGVDGIVTNEITKVRAIVNY